MGERAARPFCLVGERGKRGWLLGGGSLGDFGRNHLAGGTSLDLDLAWPGGLGLWQAEAEDPVVNVASTLSTSTSSGQVDRALELTVPDFVYEPRRGFTLDRLCDVGDGST